VLPDDTALIAAVVTGLIDAPQSIDPQLQQPPQLLLSTGGTGFSPRDVTPDALTPLLSARPCPGLVHLLLQTASAATPYYCLSRPVAGIRRSTLCVTLPGSTAAVEQGMQALLPVLPHALCLIGEQGGS
jgi:gephyrin